MNCQLLSGLCCHRDTGNYEYGGCAWVLLFRSTQALDDSTYTFQDSSSVYAAFDFHGDQSSMVFVVERQVWLTSIFEYSTIPKSQLFAVVTLPAQQPSTLNSPRYYPFDNFLGSLPCTSSMA